MEIEKSNDNAEVYSEPCQTFKMKYFAETVHSI